MKIFFLLTRTLLYTLGFALLMTLALVPNLFPLPTFYADKMLHVLVCTIILIWVHLHFGSPAILAATCALLLTAGIGLEIVQGLIPGREVSIDDIIANLAGIVSGTIIACLLRRGMLAGQRDISGSRPPPAKRRIPS